MPPSAVPASALPASASGAGGRPGHAIVPANIATDASKTAARMASSGFESCHAGGNMMRFATLALVISCSALVVACTPAPTGTEGEGEGALGEGEGEGGGACTAMVAGGWNAGGTAFGMDMT